MRRFIIFTLLFFFIGSLDYCETQQALIKDVRGEIFNDSAHIVIEANCDIEYVDYTLKDPPRIVIDPIGKVYSDLKDVITFDQGPVKKVYIMKGRAEETQAGNFYPLDFIVIELTDSKEYKVRKDIKQQVVVDILNEKEAGAPKETAPPLPAQEINVPPQPLPLPQPQPQPEGQEQAQAEEQKLVAEEPPPSSSESTPESTLPIPLPEPAKGEESAAVEPIKMVYAIGEGDSLDISVWQHPELDRKVFVRPDGYISFPLVGDINAKGSTPPQLASNIKENLSRLIKDPQVTVIVSGFGSKNIFVLGEVMKPGAYLFKGGINVLNAISEAGGWKNSAVLNSVMLVRKPFTEAPEAHRLDVYALIKKGDFSQNLPLEPGDIIYVPKSFVANIGGFIENLRITVGAYVTNTTKIFD